MLAHRLDASNTGDWLVFAPGQSRSDAAQVRQFVLAEIEPVIKPPQSIMHEVQHTQNLSGCENITMIGQCEQVSHDYLAQVSARRSWHRYSG